MRKFSILILTCVFIAACVHTAEAQIPETFSYQGVLTDAAGTPVADGSYTLTFKLYDTPDTPTDLWTESQMVSVHEGIFNVRIGSVEPLALAFDKPYYLGISIDGGAELLPRTALTSSPYAFVSMRAETASGLEPGASGVVTSINTLSGEITLEGGGGTKITRMGNYIKISSISGTGIQGVQNTDGTITIQDPTGPVATIGLADNAIGPAHLEDNAVTTAKLADASVTAAKMSGTGATSGQVLTYDGSDVSWATFLPSVTGSGTTDQLALWNGSSTITGNTNLVYSSGKFGVGASSPSATLHVSGNEGLLAEGTYDSGTAVNPGPGTRMHWYPKRGAFRAGNIDGTQWNDANIGIYSVAMGGNTTASGANSTAIGSYTTASGDYSTAMGYFTVAGGYFSTAMGDQTTASGSRSTAMGTSTTASGDYSTATGYHTTASGDYSFATGSSTTASGSSSTAMGCSTEVSGYASTAMGFQTEASGDASTAMGKETTANGANSTALGAYTTASGSSSTAMGHTNTASGENSTAMGAYTTASGNSSTAIGRNTTASGSNSTAMGNYVSTNGYEGVFIIGDNSATTIKNAGIANRFYARFANGYYLYTDNAATIGVLVTSNGNSWSSISDSTRKEGFRRTDGESLLRNFSKLRLGSWNYKDQDPTRFRHYGPMAQEWFAAFGYDGLGVIGNDTTLASADVDGILCIAVQALEKRTSELKKATVLLQQKTAEVEKLHTAIDALSDRLNKLEAERNGGLKMEHTAGVLDPDGTAE